MPHPTKLMLYLCVNIVRHGYWRQDLYFHENSDVVELDVPVIDYSEVGWGRWGQQKGNHILKDGMASLMGIK